MICKKQKQCSICNKLFLAKSNQSFCSKDCRIKNNRTTTGLKRYKPKLEKECPLCNKVFSAKSNQKYCSSDCCKIWSAKKQAAKYQKQQIKKQCLVCGKELVTNNKTKYCKDCQQKGCGSSVHNCELCGTPFYAGRYVKYCNKPHYKKCCDCGNDFILKNPKTQIRCEICQENRHEEMRNWHCIYRRLLSQNTRVDTQTMCHRTWRKDVYEKDNYICGICNLPVDRTLKYPHPLSASVDHKIAFANGGTHTMDNLQCSHLICNMKKGDSF